MSYKLRPEQKVFKKNIYDAKNPLIVGNLCRRIGKSFTAVTYSIEQAIQTRQKIRYATAFLTDLEEFILPAFEIILADCPDDIRPIYLKSKKVWKFKNGSEIKLLGLDKSPNSLRGNGISIIIVDEAGFVTHLKKIYQSVIIPATMSQKNIRLIFISTPPESKAHFFIELIAKAKATGYYLELTIDDISDLAPEEKQRMFDECGGEFSDVAQREYYVKIISDPTRAVCNTFNEKLHVQEIEEPKYANWTFAGDTGGVKDYTVAYMVAYSHILKKVIFWDEVKYLNNTPTPKIIEGFKVLEGDKRPARYIDAPGQLLVDLGFAGFSATLPPKDNFQAGLQLLRTAFYNDEVIIHPRCQFLILTLSTGLLNRTATDYERTTELGHCDAIAAAIYGIRTVDKVTDYRRVNTPQDIWLAKKPERKDISALQNLAYSGQKDRW